MIDYNFGQGLSNYDWSTGEFKDSPTQIAQYNSGILPSNLLSNQAAIQEATSHPSTNKTPPPIAKRTKKSKVWLWIIIIPILLAISYLLYNKL